VTIFFDTIDPASVPSLALGIGFPRADGGGCVVNLTATATRGSQFAIPVEGGNVLRPGVRSRHADSAGAVLDADRASLTA
jgi:hypothetical protein